MTYEGQRHRYAGTFSRTISSITYWTESAKCMHSLKRLCVRRWCMYSLSCIYCMQLYLYLDNETQLLNLENFNVICGRKTSSLQLGMTRNLASNVFEYVSQMLKWEKLFSIQSVFQQINVLARGYHKRFC